MLDSLKQPTYVEKETIKITDNFSLTDKCEFEIIFYVKNDEKIAFIWMQTSGTELVFRIMADVKNAYEEDEKKMILASLSSLIALRAYC